MRPALLICLLLAACGQPTTSNSDLAGAPDLADPGPDLAPRPGLAACTHNWQISCTRLEQCQPFLVSAIWGSVDRCVAIQAEICSRMAVAGNNTVQNVVDCGAALNPQVDCGALIQNFFSNDPGNIPTACAAIAGPGADGTACASGTQCQSLHCDLSGGPCGTCTPLGDVGAACSQDGDCKAGLACGLQSRTCAAYAQIDQPCDANHLCLPTSAACVQSVCKATVKTVGAPCGLDVGACDVYNAALFCDSTNTCQPLGSATLGQPCKLAGDAQKFCTDGSACVLSNLVTGDGTCKARATLGGACSPNGVKYPACDPTFLCLLGTCEYPDPVSCHP